MDEKKEAVFKNFMQVNKCKLVFLFTLQNFNPPVIEIKHTQQIGIMRRERIYPFRNVDKYPWFVGWQRIPFFNIFPFNVHPMKTLLMRNG